MLQSATLMRTRHPLERMVQQQMMTLCQTIRYVSGPCGCTVPTRAVPCGCESSVMCRVTRSRSSQMSPGRLGTSCSAPARMQLTTTGTL